VLPRHIFICGQGTAQDPESSAVAVDLASPASVLHFGVKKLLAKLHIVLTTDYQLLVV
jgi:hypothetical protein